MTQDASILNKPPVGKKCNGCGVCCRARVCSTGAFALGLVKRLGERVDGPCPAIMIKPDGSTSCGLVARPTDYLTGRSAGVTPLREAVKVLIGVGAGCDEADDATSAADDAALREVQARYLAEHSEDKIIRAAEIVFGTKK